MDSNNNVLIWTTDKQQIDQLDVLSKRNRAKFVEMVFTRQGNLGNVFVLDTNISWQRSFDGYIKKLRTSRMYQGQQEREKSAN